MGKFKIHFGGRADSACEWCGQNCEKKKRIKDDSQDLSFEQLRERCSRFKATVGNVGTPIKQLSDNAEQHQTCKFRNVVRVEIITGTKSIWMVFKTIAAG